MRRLLDFYDDFEMGGEAGSAEDAFYLVADTNPDVILRVHSVRPIAAQSWHNSYRNRGLLCRSVRAPGRAALSATLD
jgi:hypothetical protein